MLPIAPSVSDDLENTSPVNRERADVVPNPTEQPTMTVEEAARHLGIGRSSAYAAARAGELPTIRVGARLLVPTAVLCRMLGLEGGDAA